MAQCPVSIPTLLDLDMKICDREGIAAFWRYACVAIDMIIQGAQSETMLFYTVCSLQCCPSAPPDDPGALISRQSDTSEEESGRGAGLQ